MGAIRFESQNTEQLPLSPVMGALRHKLNHSSRFQPYDREQPSKEQPFEEQLPVNSVTDGTCKLAWLDKVDTSMPTSDFHYERRTKKQRFVHSFGDPTILDLAPPFPDLDLELPKSKQLPDQVGDGTCHPAALELSPMDFPRLLETQKPKQFPAQPVINGPYDPHGDDPFGLQLLPAEPPMRSWYLERDDSLELEDSFYGADTALPGIEGTGFNATTTGNTNQSFDGMSNAPSPSRLFQVLEADAPRSPSPFQTLEVISSRPARNQQLLDFCVLADHRSTRVETALEIRLQLNNPPPGIKRLRIHKSHLTKFIPQQDYKTKPFENDTVEVRGIVFFAQAMNSFEKTFNALSKARAMLQMVEEEKENIPTAKPPPAGDVAYTTHINSPVETPCMLCCDREKKRLLRSWKEGKDCDENPEWAGVTGKHILTMNIRTMMADWQLPPSQSTRSARQLMSAPRVPKMPQKSSQKSSRKSSPQVEGQGDKKKKKNKEPKEPPKPMPPVEEGTIAVDIPMRICCYARHHHENEGFRIIFFLYNNKGEIIGETVTDPILIADEHKEKKSPPTTPPTTPPNEPQAPAAAATLPGQGVFQQEQVQLYDPAYPQPQLFAPPYQQIDNSFPDYGQGYSYFPWGYFQQYPAMMAHSHHHYHQQ